MSSVVPPQDVSVVSFDDSDLAGWLRPPLTSLALPHDAMGRRAVELLLDDKRPEGAVTVSMRVHAGGSIAPPAVADSRSYRPV